MGKSTPFLYQKRGIFYLQKRVPKKLVPKVGRAFVRVSLRTKDRATAIQTAGSILGALDKEWHAALFAIPTEDSYLNVLHALERASPKEKRDMYMVSEDWPDAVKFGFWLLLGECADEMMSSADCKGQPQ